MLWMLEVVGGGIKVLEEVAVSCQAELEFNVQYNAEV